MREDWGWSKNGIVWIAFIVIVIVSLAVYSTYFQRLGSPPEQRIRETERMEVWMYSGEWEGVLKSFQLEHPDVEIDIRSFQTYDALASELSAAISAGRAPDVAEINNAYGMKEWMDAGVLQPIEFPGKAQGLTASARAAFTYKDVLWALPAGASVPILLYHQDKLQNAGYSGGLQFHDLRQMAGKLSAWVQGLNDRNASIKWKQILAVDGDLPLIFINLWGLPPDTDKSGHLQELLRSWHELVFEYGIMFPLQHRLALSEFMDGQVLFLLTDSQNMKWLDRYIAGKFKYGSLPLPGSEASGFEPRYSAFVVLAGEARLQRANELMRYIHSSDVQMSLLETTGYIPVREDVLTALKQQMHEGDPEALLIKLSESFHVIGPTADDSGRWRQITDSLTQLEIENEPDLERMAAELLPLLP